MAYLWITSRQRKEITAHLKNNLGINLKTAIDLQRGRPNDLKIAVGFLPELDFEGILPHNILPCGPILRSALPIEQSDPELGNWLSRGPTVYINLGSMCQIDEQQMVEMACVIKAVIDKFQTSSQRPLQVLWKLKTHKGVNTQNAKIVDILGQDIVADRVRIVDWVVSEPISILRTGNVICSVHHGGANSFNEAVVYVVPLLTFHRLTLIARQLPKQSFLSGQIAMTLPSVSRCSALGGLGTGKRSPGGQPRISANHCLMSP